MSTEVPATMPNWPALEGMVLEGGYEIGELLSSNPAFASFKARVLGDRFTEAIVSAFSTEVITPERYKLWSDATELRHAWLSPPISIGKLDWGGDCLPYVVLPQADESLTVVLKERALTAEETREMLQILLGGLQYLHANGFVHSCLGPDEVLAFGNSIRLSTTGIRRINTPAGTRASAPSYRAPESSEENLTTAADVWCLGATLLEVLTQTRCGEDCRELSKSLPEPFNWIVARCIDPDPQTRCTLNDVGEMLSGRQTRPVGAQGPIAAQAMPAAEAVVSQASASASEARVFIAGAGVARKPEPRRLPQPRSGESARPRLAPPSKPVYTEQRSPRLELAPEPRQHAPRTRFLGYAIVTILVAGALLWVIRLKSPKPSVAGSASIVYSARSTPVPGAQSRTVQPAVVPGAAAMSTPSLNTAAVNTAAVNTAASSTRTPVSSGKNTAWRVVAFTFARREEADRSARRLHEKHPRFNPEVFKPSGDSSGPYLVVLGGAMTSRAEADRVRQKARSSGFPRDTYVQNYSR